MDTLITSIEQMKHSNSHGFWTMLKKIADHPSVAQTSNIPEFMLLASGIETNWSAIQA